MDYEEFADRLRASGQATLLPIACRYGIAIFYVLYAGLPPLNGDMASQSPYAWGGTQKNVVNPPEKIGK